MALTDTVVLPMNPVPLITTGVGRAVEPTEGEIAVTLGASSEMGVTLGAVGGTSVGSDGDRPSQALDAIANANSNTLRRVLFVMAFSLLVRKRENTVKT
jgi:hypothetical protein